jgi:hypothetical protein
MFLEKAAAVAVDITIAVTKVNTLCQEKIL